jgi:ankyrin repeat protein
MADHRAHQETTEMRDLSLDSLRLEAKRLHRAFIARDPWALERLAQYPSSKADDRLVRADFLHVIAQQNGFASWPTLKQAAELQGLDRATALQKLKIAMANGRNGLAQDLLARWPDLADGVFGLECALYRRAAVEAALQRDPGLAVRRAGPRSPILHLAFSKWHQAHPELHKDMLAIADLLLAHGADVNDGAPYAPGETHLLSALYGALGHADNMPLARWFLDHGADPDDGESLYHATELGHHDGLRLLLAAGANPQGTNALLRAMDFDDVQAVALLLQHGADANEFNPAEVGGETPWVIPALHQAARRGCCAEMVDLLLDAGANPMRQHNGASAYGFARAYGHHPLAKAIEARGMAIELTAQEQLLAAAAEGRDSAAQIEWSAVPAAYHEILRELLPLPGRLPHIKRLVRLGVPFDAPGSEGLTPVQIAGWEGLPEMLEYFLSLGPNLGHVNAYGGTLLSTILHGAEHCPTRDTRDHATCLTLVLQAGVPLPRVQIGHVDRDDLRVLLEDWGEQHHEQVV